MAERSTLIFETYLLTLDLTYQVRMTTLDSAVLKKSHLNALGSKYDLDVK